MRELQGRHVLAAVLGFFAIVFLVNGVFLYAALSTYTGVVAKEPYRKGLRYNERIAAGERQAALGWTDEAMLARSPDILTLSIKDLKGAPVSGLFVKGVLGRPSTSQHDVEVSLTETAPGLYRAPLRSLGQGAWLATLEAVWPGTGSSEPVYRVRKRLWLEP